MQTTKVLYEGQVVDISNATPNLVYQGIYTGASSATDSKWNVTTTTTNPVPLSTYDPGYTQGGNGGSLAITSAAMTLDGVLFGQTYAGPNQLKPFVPYASSSLQSVVNASIDPIVWELGNQPELSSLKLTFVEQYQESGDSYVGYSPAPPNIYFLPAAGVVAGDPNALVLSPGLTDPNATTYGGFGNLAIDDSADNYQVSASNALVIPVDPSTGQTTLKFGNIIVGANPADPANVTLRTAPGGSITFDAANITLDGGLSSPGGKLTMTAHNFWQNSPYLTTGTSQTDGFGTPAYNAARGNLVVETGVTVNVDGLVVDNRTASANQAPLVTGGGSVSLLGSSVTVDSGAIISASGGAAIGPTGAVSYGNGGSVTLKAGVDPAATLAHFPILGGTLDLDVSDQVTLAPFLVPLQAYSGTGGGSLTLVAPLVQVGDTGLTPPAGTLVLPSSTTTDGSFLSFFNAGGFKSFTIDGIGSAQSDAKGNPLKDSSGNALFNPGVLIASGTQVDPTLVHPRVEQLEIIPNSTAYASTVIAPPAYQNTPVSLAFGALGAKDTSQSKTGFSTLVVRGDLVIDQGATIATDPQPSGGGVTLSGDTVAVLGTVIVPGGAISITGATDSTALFASEGIGLPTVDLGPNSGLSTAGITLLAPDEFGRVLGEPGYLNTGSVLPGGSVTITGNIVAEASSQINVSGWSDTRDSWGLLEMAPQFSGTSTSTQMMLQFIPTVVASNGGSLNFRAGQSLFPDATLSGAAGGPSAVGGTLSATGPVPSGVLAYTTLLVSAAGPTIPAPFYEEGETAIGHAVLDASGNPLTGVNLGNFASSSFTGGGFDSLNIHGTVLFQGDVTIAAKGSHSVGDSGVVGANGTVSLSGAEVSIGQPYLSPVVPQDIPPAIEANDRMVPYPPTFGTGQLFVSAGAASSPGLINMGNLTLQTIGQASFASVGGDIQGFGTVDIAGQLTISANLVYPPTGKTFTLGAYNYTSGGMNQPGTVTFQVSDPTSQRPVPLSAGGTFELMYAAGDQSGRHP